jgi:hypothetical protein
MKGSLWTRAAAVALAGMLLAGCASIFSGTNQNVNVRSTPMDAEVKILTKEGISVAQGRTPMMASVERGEEFVVYISKAGYQPVAVGLDKGLNLFFVGNLLCGGLLGVTIDLLDGAAYKVQPGTVQVVLEEVEMASGGSDLILSIAVGREEGAPVCYRVPLVPELPGEEL